MAIELGTGLVAVGAGLAIMGGALGTAWAQAAIGSALMGLLAEKDDPRALLFLAIPETMVILGFVVAFLILSNLGGA